MTDLQVEETRPTEGVTAREEEVEQEEEFNPEVDKARREGWVTQEEWEEQGKNPSDWVNASIFNMRGDFFKEIKNLRGELSTYRQTINDLKEHNTKLAKKEKDSLLKQLKQQKIEAVSQGDGEAVSQIDDWIDEVKKEPEPHFNTQHVPTAQDNSHLFVEWSKKNPWYGTDKEMSKEADDLGVMLTQRKLAEVDRPLNGDEIYDIYNQVTSKIKRMFPEKNVTSRRAVLGATNSSPTKSGSKKRYTLNDVPEQFRDIAKRFSEKGHITVEQYIEQLKQTGDL